MILIISTVFAGLIELIYGKYSNTKKINVLADYNKWEYINRDEEKIIMKAIKQKRLVYVSGCSGIGKTFFLSKIQNDINKHKKFKGYFAMYFVFVDGQDPQTTLRNQFGFDNNETFYNILEYIDTIEPLKKKIFILDNMQQHTLAVEDIASRILNYNNENRLIIANKISLTTKPGILLKEFKKRDIVVLAQKIQVQLSELEVEKIALCTNGLPVFISYLIKNIAFSSFEVSMENCNDINEYVYNKYQSLSSELQDCLLFLCFLDMLPSIEKRIKDIILSNYDTINEINLKLLYSEALIDKLDNPTINSSIAAILRKRFASKRFEYCEKLMNLFKTLKKDDEYLFYSLLYNKNNHIDELQFILNSLVKGKKYQFIIYLIQNTILQQTSIYKANNDFYRNLLFAYLYSLAEIGEYKEALNFIDSEDFDDSFFSHPDACSFDVNYLIADIKHLVCEYDDALYELDILKNRPLSIEQKNKCIWLEGHIYRHMGEFENAIINFYFIKKSKKVTPKIFLKSLYSIMSIHIYMGKSRKQIENDKIILEKAVSIHDTNGQYTTSVNRHIAIFERRVNKNYELALKILNETVIILNNTPERIIYDYYFEIAENYRCLCKKYNDGNWKEAFLYYKKALNFAKNIEDKNLLENCKLGIILLNIRNPFEKEMCVQEIATLLAEESANRRLGNYINLKFIKHYIENDIKQQFIEYLITKQFDYHLNFYNSNSKIEYFELMVM